MTRGKRMVKLAKKPDCTKDTSLLARIPRIQKEQITYNGEDLIGSGSYGNCFRGIYRGNIPVVLKKFKSSTVDEVLNEALVIQELQKVEHHPCLPFLIGVYLKSKPYMLVTQFHGGSDGIQAYSLSSAVEAKLITDKPGWMRILIQLARALGFVHNCGYLHNDLKENNVVLHYSKNEWNPVIIDFGKSTKMSSQALPAGKKKELAGRYHWIAPEILSGTSFPSKSSDVFSLGRIIRFVTKSTMDHADRSYFKMKELYLLCTDPLPSLRPKSGQAVAAKLLAIEA